MTPTAKSKVPDNMKRLPIIRHVRYFWYSFWLSCWVAYYQRVGLGFFAQPSDLKFIQDVWEGKA